MADRRVISDIRIGKRFRKNLGDIEDLAKSIDNIGLLHPVVITPQGELIAGQRRLEACKLLGWERIPVNAVDLENIVQGEYDENMKRIAYTPSECFAIWEALESHQGKQQLPSDSDGSEPRQKVSKLTGKSTDTLSKIKQVVEAAQEEPELFEPVVQEMDETGNVNKAYRKVRQQQSKKEAGPLPKDKYDVIYADPPWPYDNTGLGSDNFRTAAKKYLSLSLPEIINLPVKDLTAKNSTLFLWVTNPFLKEGLEVCEAWGFKYKTNFIWVKEKHSVGFYALGQHELLFVAVKGSHLPEQIKPSVIFAGSERHSQKPELVYELIEKMYPQGKYIELFARQGREKWVSWGDEI